ncbi:MAG TPA: hypothetical protein VFV87_20820 [Pirellulaceae bacterium]|nr:hypothetical protein [Pirellulaceae bacterium]
MKSLGELSLVLLVAALLAGCDASGPAPTANAPTPPAPPAPPPPPGTGGAPAAGAAAPKAPVPELQPYWGQNYIVFVFARDRHNKSYQDAKADWQAHRTDQEGKPIMFVEFIGTISGETFDKLTFQVEGGPTISGKSASDLWDSMGASNSVTSILIIGKDGKMIFDKRRGGDVDLAAALEPL